LIIVQDAVGIGVKGGGDEHRAAVGRVVEVGVLDGETVGPADLAGDFDAATGGGIWKDAAHAGQEELGVFVGEIPGGVTRVVGFAGVFGHGIHQQRPVCGGEPEG